MLSTFDEKKRYSGIVAHACNPIICKTKARWSLPVGGQPGQHSPNYKALSQNRRRQENVKEEELKEKPEEEEEAAAVVLAAAANTQESITLLPLLFPPDNTQWPLQTLTDSVRVSYHHYGLQESWQVSAVTSAERK